MVKNDSNSMANLAPLSGPQASRLVSALIQDASVSHSPEGIDPELPTIKNYVIDRCLGSGGGGSVFHGMREGTDRSVAIKVLHKRLSQHDAAERAWRELDLLEQIRLPGFPHLYDYGVQDGRMFIVSEHVQGRSFNAYCRTHSPEIKECVKLLITIARKIQRLHEHGIIHRDLKPENIRIDAAGEPIIIDLGIATLIADDVMETLTTEGTPLDSPAFLAPEQARGEKKAISTRSDIYGLAATACLILTGETPHDVNAPLHESIRRIAQDAPRSLRKLMPSLPTPLARVLDRALSFEPSQRYASMSAFADDLQRWLDGYPIVWQNPGWLTRQRLELKRNPKMWGLKAAVWLLLVLTVGSTAAAVGFQNVASMKAEVALQKGQLLEETEQNVAIARENATKARQLAADREQFAREQEALKEHWETEARRLEAFRIDLTERMERFKQRRVNMVARVKMAVENHDIQDALLDLMVLGDDLENENFTDIELIQWFNVQLDKIFEMAAQSKITDETS